MTFTGIKYLKPAAVVWVICLAIFIPAYMFVLKPQAVQFDSLTRDCNDCKRKAEVAWLESQGSTLLAVQKRIDEMKLQLDRFVVPSKEDIQSLASLEIYNMSKEIGLDAFHIDPWSGGDISAFSECKYVSGQPMKVTFEASFQQFAKFINMLESYKSVIFIDSFSITRSRNDNAKHKVDMNIAVLVAKKTPVKGARS
jgi:Tfp pilus assembly protein PilO